MHKLKSLLTIEKKKVRCWIVPLNAKSILKTKNMLTYFDPDLEIIVDVNNYGNGAVILIQNGKIRAVAHASSTLIAAKKKL